VRSCSREPAFHRPPRVVDRRRLLARYELQIGEKHVGVEVEGELLGILRSIDVAFGLGVANGRLEQPSRAGIPATDIFEVADTVVVRPDPVAVPA
jgi:hypothetical protein